MADKDDIDVSKPREAPKPVHIGGESIADRILPHIKKIIVTVILVAVVLSVVFGVRAWQRNKESDATEKVANVLSLSERRVAVPGAPHEDPNKEPTFPDVKSRATALLDEIAKQGTDKMGAAYRGGLLMDAGKVDEAIIEYRKGSSGDDIEAVFAREGLGIALETKALADKDAAARQKGLDEALAAFVAMQPKKDGPRRAYALYHQGRIQQILGKTAEAKALYDEAKTAGGESSELASLIEKRLASLGAS